MAATATNFFNEGVTSFDVGSTSNGRAATKQRHPQGRGQRPD